MSDEELVVLTSDNKSTTLENPKTKVKTIVPKDPNKPGMIRKDSENQMVLDKETTGNVDNSLKPGQKVIAKKPT